MYDCNAFSVTLHDYSRHSICYTRIKVKTNKNIVAIEKLLYFIVLALFQVKDLAILMRNFKTNCNGKKTNFFVFNDLVNLQRIKLLSLYGKRVECVLIQTKISYLSYRHTTACRLCYKVMLLRNYIDGKNWN